ncbi:MAG: cytochrome c biogenesis protein CcsA, partial [Natronohydrobacter sp.]|nr:cytochrome c biogenesis protein CcsA [Natronohydrobacter sp.]
MLAEFGILALVVAFIFAISLVVIPGIGLYRQNEAWINRADYYVAGQFIGIALSWLILSLCFVRDDFSVLYVFNNSSRSLPIFYKICAVWGGHEGSMLLWVAVLSFWMLLVSRASRQLPQPFRVRVLIILGLLSVGLILFLLTVSNPFARQFQDVHSQGRDLNPLLQDPGFLFHPPMLYMGYVGFSVAFAMAIEVLWLVKIEISWAKWTLP